MHRIRIGTFMVWLAGYLLLGVGGSGSAVLCVGADGHIEWEAWYGSACADLATAPAGQAATGRRSAPADEDDHCGQCVDIPVSLCSVGVPPTSRLGPTPTLVRMAPLPASQPADLPVACDRGWSAAFECPDARAPSAAALRSVILLI